MALINCPDCGRDVSDRAEACPACGCPIAKKKGLSSVACTGLAVFITGLIASLYSVPKFFSAKAAFEASYKSGNSLSARYNDMGRMLESYRLVASISLIVLLLGVTMFVIGLVLTKREQHKLK